jgi:hypothetical protein
MTISNEWLPYMLGYILIYTGWSVGKMLGLSHKAKSYQQLYESMAGVAQNQRQIDEWKQALENIRNKDN